jgi:phosphoglycolate phosphatase
MSRLLCFDLDGCLVDSDAAIADALNHALEVLGLRTRSAAELRSAVGPPLVQNLVRLLAEDGIDAASGEGRSLVDRGVVAYRSRYAEVGFDLTAPYPGIVAALDALEATGGVDGAAMVVVTAKPAVVAADLLARVGLRGRFAGVHGTPAGVDVQEKEVTLAGALREHGAAPAAAVMIGDRAYDVRAGRVCGTATVGVLWGAGDRDELVNAGADALAELPSDLPSLAERLLAA